MSKTKQKIYRYLAFFMTLNILAEVVSPTVALALTGGPSQPEVESFEPVGTSEMVDLFSGDFNYNIPLLTVPGPNGGYPINLAYHAGIGMEQEASWVGLGWNINPGVINRQMRGLPDDFKGETVRKEINHKPNWTFGLGMEVISSATSILSKKEWFGLDLKINSKYGYELFYNNYKGLGANFSYTRTPQVAGMAYKLKPRMIAGLSLKLGTQSGIDLQGSISLYKQMGDKLAHFDAGIGYNSRNSIYDMTVGGGWMNTPSHTRISRIGDRLLSSQSRSVGTSSFDRAFPAGLSFCGSSYTPSSSVSLYGVSANLKIKCGQSSVFGALKGRNIFGYYSRQWIANTVVNQPAYGYNYLENTIAGNGLMDFNRGKEYPVTKKAPALPSPTATYDVYTISGQGTGGFFRPFRSDIGIYSQPSVDGTSGGVDVGLELGFGNAPHIGGYGGYTLSSMHSGNWTNYNDAIAGNYGFSGNSTPTDLNEPFYYKIAGEQTTDISYLNEMERYGGLGDPVKLRLSMQYAGLSFKPKVHNQTSKGTTALGNNTRSHREKRMQSVEYKTFTQIKDNEKYNNRSKNIWSGAPNTWTENSSNYTAYDFTYDDNANNIYPRSSQTATMSVVNPDGNRYEYGLPAYNTKHKDVVFTCDNAVGTSGYLTKKTVGYGSEGQNANANHEGADNFFNSTTLPQYAHAYLLTAIYSPDYVDLTGDGPSKDDLGYYVKFNYIDNGIQKWRTPYMDANLDKGGYSNNIDDKAYYSYGEKKVYYVHSVETKTHVALFQLSDRSDAFGATDEHQQSTAFDPASSLTAITKAKKLDKIILYSKLDLANPIKTVNFAYDYSLCPGAPNNNQSTVATIYGVNTGATSNPKKPVNGKLTLKKVWFEYLGNNKGRLSPYVFDYNETKYLLSGSNGGVTSTQVENPSYNLSQMDRWGYYKEDHLLLGTTNSSNEDDPYVKQNDKATQDRYMSVWNLKKITLPSGGDINISYEADDYAYVQDRPAMQMFKIVGTNWNGSSFSNDISGTNYRIYFELDKDKNGVPIDGSIDPYIKNIDHLYFKTFMELKKKPDFSAVASDYVSGYCEIDPSPSTRGIALCGSTKYGYFSVKEVPVGKKLGKTHPFRKAAWEYLRNQRPDLLYPMDITDFQSGASAFLFSFVSLVKEIGRTVTGYFNFCKITGIAKRLDLSSAAHPSFVRLNTPDAIKFGGGHRVKSISITDNWNTMSASSEADFNYGQEYSYTMPDGSSSGVAEYEPAIGGEENPFHLPSDKYKSRDFVFASKDLYLEEPYNEAYYPGASVGYRRVVVKSKNGTGTEAKAKSASGIVVHEFYTAKEFPVLHNETKVSAKKYSPFIPIPFIGHLNIDNCGYTQGYSIELNDMHGKSRSQATYAFGADINNPATVPVSKVEYVYTTEKPFDPNATNHLSNVVQVLDGDSQVRTGNMGLSSEFFIDLDENSSFSIHEGLGPNIDAQITPAPVAVPSLWPQFTINESMYRAVVTNKIIYRTGILQQVRNYKDGAMAISNNLMFDSETGQALLTSVTNDFDAPVYTYNYAAHWQYPGMRGAYKNIGFKTTVSTTGSSTTIAGVTDYTPYFTTGDEVTLKVGGTFKNYWVSSISSGSFTLIDETGANPATGSYELTVIRSGNRNQQSVSMGEIVSLTNMVTDNFPIINALSTALASPSFVLTNNSFNYSYINCAGYTIACTATALGLNTANPTLSIHYNETNDLGQPIICEDLVLNLKPYTTNISLSKLRFYAVVLGGGVIKVYEYDVNSPEVLYIAKNSIDPYNCFKPCNNSVLHAEAYRFKDNFSNAFDYADMGDPAVRTTPATVALSTASTQNPYRYGAKGIWRNAESYVYQTDRKQTTPHSNIAIDGMYKKFAVHNWNIAYTSSNEWTKVSEVSRYNPYGFETENKDALNLYSSAMYGYNNSMPVAVAKNSGYFEMAYDGFEDYGNVSVYPTSGSAYHGHLKFTGGTFNLATEAHTGSKSLQLNAGASMNYSATDLIDGSVKTMSGHTYQYFSPRTTTNSTNGGNTNTQYLISFWVKKAGALSPGNDINIGLNLSSISPAKVTRMAEVEKWQKIETAVETLGLGSFDLSIINNGSGTLYIDDIRIQPLKSAMTTYVYDPKTLWLLAELDNRNYATFYNYDQEGSLVQVKKETEKGVMTIKTSRNNTKRNVNP